jgi:hypothetical protein
MGKQSIRVGVVRGFSDICFLAFGVLGLQLSELCCRKGIMGITEKLIGVQVDINTPMIHGNCMMERFVTDGRNSVTNALTNKDIVNSSAGCPNVGAWLHEGRKPLLPDIDHVALVQADLL